MKGLWITGDRNNEQPINLHKLLMKIMLFSPLKILNKILNAIYFSVNSLKVRMFLLLTYERDNGEKNTQFYNL